MRLKTFHAKTINEAMNLVRNELGADAVIIQTDESRSGVRVTAALEAGATPLPPKTAPTPQRTPIEIEKSQEIAFTAEFDTADIRAVLSHHGLPFDTAGHIEKTAAAVNAASLSEAVGVALETVIRFSPMTEAHTRPVMLVGPPGVGKTVCAAKLTADALLHGRSVHLISTDTKKAGGIQQLDHFAQLMKQTVSTAASPHELAAVMKSKSTEDCLTIIDSPGTNAFDMQELKTLLNFIQQVDAEPVLVMPAGLDPLDAQEIAGVFSRMGCQRFVATRLDAARRYAGIIMAARPGYLALAAISRSPFIADGLETATPIAFSRLLTTLPGGKKSGHNRDTRHD